ncbi:uncharacterized protein si:dkey-273o13.3 [Rhinichthys klamathensis goyatoka]|uniref:uncharacterized protein si:dkey-273o13.3 n=1 Tax=Rhinichthys klamathensis goyatoka TaxID=3034132 RepID=UPI0024B4814C|nr:uncharacterized protein si:dkey-273o13.3 [Rhinichthys klamathensis goyatoka]
MEKNLTVKEKSGGTAKKATYSREQKGNKGQEQNHAKAAANIRKTKSMEVLSRRVDHAGSGYLDEKELEKRKQEAHKVFVKEKIKFSAFLNEITRQVLSPSRLTSLGVTHVHRPSSPGQTSTSPKALSPKPEHKTNARTPVSTPIPNVTHIQPRPPAPTSILILKGTSSINNSVRLFPGVVMAVQEVIQAILALPQNVFHLGLNVVTKFRSSTKLPPKRNISIHRIIEIHTTNHLQHTTITMKIIIAHLHVLVLQNQKTAIVIPIKNRITIIPIKNLITIIHHRHLISTMELIIAHHHTIILLQILISTMELITAHHHTIILLQIPIILLQIPIIIHPLHHNTIMELTAAQQSLLSQALTIIFPIQKLILLTKNHTTTATINIHLHRHITTMDVTAPQFQNLPTIIPVQNLTTIIRLLLSTTMESMKLQHHHSDHESSHPKSHHHHHHSHPNHSSNTIQHHHTSDSHTETRQHSHSRNASPTPEHHYHSSHTDSHHSPHQHHHHVSDSYPKGPAHSNSAHHYENHPNTHSESQDHSASHPKGHLSRLELHLHSDHDPPESHPKHFPSGSHEPTPVEPDHYHHHKSQESHHYSHSNSHHHSNPESNHPQHHEHSESHHRSQPESHHHHSQDHHHYHDNPESQNQHSNTEHHHFHSESNHYHSHFKEDHHNDDHTSHLRHSPVGQRSTSPHSNKSNSSASSTIQDDQSTVSYQESSSYLKEKDSELERLTMLQEQNEVLHHSLLQTTVRMECMGSEFKTGHQLIESELQRTRIELNSLLERFTRLQDNYSSTQQTNHLLEKKLHCVAQNMDGERERLNQRISELSDQLSTAKTTIQSLETINVTSMLQDALVKHLKSDDPMTPLPVAPPPAQFMDSDRYDKVSMHGDDQSLGTLPEEEESDWSEMGEEAQICVLRGSQGNHGNASYYQWQQRQGCWGGLNQYSKGNVDTESESGGEESKCHQPPHGLQIPHLKFTVHPETLPIPMADVSLACFNQGPDDPDCDGYHITDVRNLGSPIRVLSASLEEIHSIGILKQQEQQQDHHKSMMDLHQSQVCTRQVLYEDEIECDWREANSHGAGEHLNGMVGLESAQKMLNHYIHDGESTHL